ncbi:MAG: hypothetical protein FWC40_04185 [Proteobacteria bacterium]|nr:hypothetical protein [Pseudomonadota bacterium]
MNNTHKKLGLIGMGVAAAFTLTACYGMPYGEFRPKSCVDLDNTPQACDCDVLCYEKCTGYDSGCVLACFDECDASEK